MGWSPNVFLDKHGQVPADSPLRVGLRHGEKEEKLGIEITG